MYQQTLLTGCILALLHTFIFIIGWLHLVGFALAFTKSVSWLTVNAAVNGKCIYILGG